MSTDLNGAREASLAAVSFGVLFMCMLGFLAASDAGDRHAASDVGGQSRVASKIVADVAEMR